MNLLACHQIAHAQARTLTIPYPDDPSRLVEAFVEKPAGQGPWPTVVLLHGYQTSPSAGRQALCRWGVLDELAKRGYLAVAVSQPGFGKSSGPAHFCGPLTQHAVLGVIAKLKSDRQISKVVIEGISRGALVAGLVAAYDTANTASLAGVILISGLYDLPQFAANPKSPEAKEIVSSMIDETGGGPDALRTRSVLDYAQNVKVPVLILNGAKDDRTDPAQARRLAEKLVSHGVQARVIVYPDYGHQIPVGFRQRSRSVYRRRLKEQIMPHACRVNI